MTTWLPDFRARFEAAVHELLWRQWTLLGAAGAAGGGETSSPLDPEALLLLTVESARTEPRLFDEVLDWLLKHGSWIDVQRLRNLLKEDAGGPAQIVAAVAGFVGESDSSSKWKRLAEIPRKAPRETEPLFLLPGNEALTSPASINSLFTRYGYRRPRIRTRELTGPLPMRLAAGLRFRLRALFGIGIRAEVLSYLISGRSGNGMEIARAAAYSPLGIHQALQELVQSESVKVRAKGRERVYWTHSIQWWDFLGVQRRTLPGRIVSTPEGLAYQDADIKPLKDAKGRAIGWAQSPDVTWTDWRSLFRGVTAVLRLLRRPELATASSYAAESELGQTLAKAAEWLTAPGSPFQPASGESPKEQGEQLMMGLAALGSGSR
jgi:hypothetical protein